MVIRLLPVLALGCLAAGGCKKDEFPRVAVVPAAVKVQHKGKPAVGAQVVLVKLNDDAPDGIKPRGRVGADGTVKLGTYAIDDGVPPGEYQVSIRWTARVQSKDEDGEDAPPGPPGGVQPDRLGERYSNPKTSGLKVKIDEAGKLEPAVLDLK